MEILIKNKKARDKTKTTEHHIVAEMEGTFDGLCRLDMAEEKSLSLSICQHKHYKLKIIEKKDWKKIGQNIWDKYKWCVIHIMELAEE